MESAQVYQSFKKTDIHSPSLNVLLNKIGTFNHLHVSYIATVLHHKLERAITGNEIMRLLSEQKISNFPH